jgi:phosphate transport system protein
MRIGFDIKLKEVKDLILQMGDVVADEIEMVMVALLTQNMDMLEKVREMEAESDRLEHVIEEKCITLIALQQPLAKDLRMISAALKIVTDLERIGDHGVNIANVTEKLGSEPFIKPLVDLPKMASYVNKMIRGSLSSFVHEDVEEACRIAQMDDQVDALYEKIYMELLGMLAQDKEIMNQVINLLFVGRFLERIADHTTNICEASIYFVKGERVEFQ